MFGISRTTLYKYIDWLKRHEYITVDEIDKGKKNVITVNMGKLEEYITPFLAKINIKRIKKREKNCREFKEFPKASGLKKAKKTANKNVSSELLKDKPKEIITVQTKEENEEITDKENLTFFEMYPELNNIVTSNVCKIETLFADTINLIEQKKDDNIELISSKWGEIEVLCFKIRNLQKENRQKICTPKYLYKHIRPLYDILKDKEYNGKYSIRLIDFEMLFGIHGFELK